jgi:membrane associated rhomboid family serine protease
VHYVRGMRNDWSRSLSSSLGPGSRGLLAAIGALGIVGALSARGSGSVFSLLACANERVLRGEVWRLFTASLLTAPQLTHLLFTLLVLYMFAPGMELRWGTRRFLAFLAWVSALGFGVQALAGSLAPGVGGGFHYGPGLLVAGLTSAWGREHPRAEIRLFFVLPVKGSAMVWVTIGFALLGLVYPGDVPEGSLGILVAALLGVALAGSPSPLRRAWLKARLAWLEVRGKRVRMPDAGATPKRSASHLRAIRGGRDDDRGPWLN